MSDDTVPALPLISICTLDGNYPIATYNRDTKELVVFDNVRLSEREKAYILSHAEDTQSHIRRMVVPIFTPEQREKYSRKYSRLADPPAPYEELRKQANEAANQMLQPPMLHVNVMYEGKRYEGDIPCVNE